MSERIVESELAKKSAAVETNNAEALASVRRQSRRPDPEADAIRFKWGPGAPSSGPGYLRKTDWLRAQFLPEVEVLDFRGLLVGNKGLWILGDRESTRRADPNRVADLLHRGNGYRSTGNHVKALTCYQELIELDPHNPDFRFLLELTYQAIAAGD